MSYELSFIKDTLTILHKDNVAYIVQIEWGYIKNDQTKHIFPKFFYTHKLQKIGDINVQQIRSIDNLANLFTKALSITTFMKFIYQIKMHQLKDLNIESLKTI